MADRDYKAFIVEGEVREPQIIDNISKVFFAHGNFKIITLPAEENIYMLWKKLKADDFDTDIIEVLRESNDDIREQLVGLSRDDFSEVYLFFDYDMHQTNLGKEDDADAVAQMLESFDNETENGKLYISYPMVEALRDYKPGLCGEKQTCYALLAEMQLEMSTEYIERIKDYNLPEDLDKVNREFFVFSAEQGLAYEKITCSGTYHSIRDEMVENVNDAGWSRSKKYQKLPDYEKKLLMDFINNAVLTAYRQWVEDRKKLPLDEVVEVTNRIVLGGVNGFFK